MHSHQAIGGSLFRATLGSVLGLTLAACADDGRMTQPQHSLRDAGALPRSDKAARPRIDLINRDGTVRVRDIGRQAFSDSQHTALITQADSTLVAYIPQTSKAWNSFGFAWALRAAADTSQLRSVLAARAPTVFRSARDSSDSNRDEVISFVRSGKRFMQVAYPYQRRSAANVAFSLDCASYPPETPETDLPAECDEGYDPNWDPTALENDVAALLGTTDAMEDSGVSATAVAISASSRAAFAMFSVPMAALLSPSASFPSSVLLSDCNEAKAMLNVALVGAGFWSTLTLYYAFRRNPIKAYRNFLAASAAVGAALVAKGKLDDCEDPQ